MKRIKVNWSNWPNRESKRGPSDLYRVSARCDAWKIFLRSKTIEKLKQLKGHCSYFNQYEYFDNLICEFSCSKKKLVSTIESLMRRGHEQPVEFSRTDIYDSRAWASFPLECFAKIDGCNERDGKDRWGEDILKYNEMPTVLFGIKQKWVVDRSCFSLTHRLKYDERHAVMTFKHPQLDSRFDNKRWAREMVFPKKTTREEMTRALFAKVKNECNKHLVIIQDEK